ncbi:MAG: hypothetical protein IIA05_04360 [Proteobacteria bacterium]|nr:hypothetical protein [Pseudomonadota bacterium]
MALTIVMSRPAEISRAIDDFEKIQRVISLWSGTWLQNYAFAKFPELQDVSYLPTEAQLKFSSPWLGKRSESLAVPVRLKIIPGIVARSSSGELGVYEGLGYFSTLASFRRLWDGLGESLDLLSPSEGSLIGSNFQVALWEQEGDQDIEEMLYGEVVEASDTEVAGGPSELILSITHAGYSTPRMRGSHKPMVSGVYLVASVTRWVDADDRWISALLGSNAPAFGDVLIPIQAYRTRSIHGQAALSEFFGVDFERYGSFAEAFRELDGFTSEIGDVRLDSVARVLENERKRTSESFQAFGLKVPAAELYRWGSPLLVVIQLYFLLHLNALTSAVAASERRSVPWIGIYNNRLSRTVTVTSAVMLPLAVVVVLQLDGWSSHWLGWLLNGTLVAASTTIGGFTAAALHKIHQESAS